MCIYISLCGTGLIEAFTVNIVKIPIRFFIVDDSGSMSTSDGMKIIGTGAKSKVINCTRWSELSQTVKFHAELADATSAPTEFRLLNGADPVVVGMGNSVWSLDIISISFLMLYIFLQGMMMVRG